jgi:hypothetical protein
MKKILILTFALFLTGSIEMNAQKLSVSQQKKVDQLFSKQKVVYFSFMVNSMQQIPGLAKIVTVEKTKGNTVFAHADKEQFSKFMEGNYAYTVIPHASAKPKVSTSAKTSTTTKAKATKSKKTKKKPATKSTTTK